MNNDEPPKDDRTADAPDEGAAEGEVVRSVAGEPGDSAAPGAEVTAEPGHDEDGERAETADAQPSGGEVPPWAAR